MCADAVNKVATELIYVWALDSKSPYMPQVDEIIREQGWTELNDNTARVLCAVDDKTGTVVGFHVLQLFPHVEPLWVHPDYRGYKVADRLADNMMSFMLGIGARGFMVVADSAHAEHLCKEYGMKLVTSPVYVY